MSDPASGMQSSPQPLQVAPAAPALAPAAIPDAPAPQPRSLADPAVLLSVIAIGGFFTLIVLLIFHGVPAESKDMVFAAIGAWGGGIAGMAASYWWGTNRASASKDATIASIAKGP